MVAKRPIVVSIIVILEALTGVLAIALAIIAGALGAAPPPPCPFGVLCANLHSFLFPTSAISIVIGIIALLAAYGLLKGKKWAWWLTVIFSAYGILSGIDLILGGTCLIPK